MKLIAVCSEILAVLANRIFTAYPSFNKARASANTASKSVVFPSEMSFSPRASKCSNSLSCSDRSYSSVLIITAAALPRWVIMIGSREARTRRKTLAASCLKSVIGMIFGTLPMATPPTVRLNVSYGSRDVNRLGVHRFLVRLTHLLQPTRFRCCKCLIRQGATSGPSRK